MMSRRPVHETDGREPHLPGFAGLCREPPLSKEVLIYPRLHSCLISCGGHVITTWIC